VLFTHSQPSKPKPLPGSLALSPTDTDPAKLTTLDASPVKPSVAPRRHLNRWSLRGRDASLLGSPCSLLAALAYAHKMVMTLHPLNFDVAPWRHTQTLIPSGAQAAGTLSPKADSGTGNQLPLRPLLRAGHRGKPSAAQPVYKGIAVNSGFVHGQG
jgi:hypothetical protein